MCLVLIALMSWNESNGPVKFKGEVFSILWISMIMSTSKMFANFRIFRTWTWRQFRNSGSGTCMLEGGRFSMWLYVKKQLSTWLYARNSFNAVFSFQIIATKNMLQNIWFLLPPKNIQFLNFLKWIQFKRESVNSH